MLNVNKHTCICNQNYFAIKRKNIFYSNSCFIFSYFGTFDQLQFHSHTGFAKISE